MGIWLFASVELHVWGLSNGFIEGVQWDIILFINLYGEESL